MFYDILDNSDLLYILIINDIQMHKYRKAILIPFIILVFVSGCTPIATQGQSNVSSTQYWFSNSSTIGQSFTSRHNGLDGMRIYISSTRPHNSVITLTIYDSPAKKLPISSGNALVNGDENIGYQDIYLDHSIKSYLKDYYFELSSDDDTPLFVGTDSIDSYLDGSLYVNGSPITAQLTFQPLYKPEKLVWGLMIQAGIWGLWLLIALYLFIIPGFACLFAIKGTQHTWPSVIWTAGAAAISISIYPLVMLFTSILSLRLGILYAILPGAVGTIYLFYRWLKAKRPIPDLSMRLRILFHSPDQLITMIVVGIIIFTRFWAIRAIPLPMWGDTIHHTLITQLMLDHGGLFSSWQPYAEMMSMNYHFGFHVDTAVFSWITGVSAAQATLVVGQLMNIFAVLAVYALAWKTAGNRKWAGISALIIAGLLSSLPMFYINWSRYTQLAGQVILPMSVFFLWEELDSEQFHFQWTVIIGISAAGLALTHYRVAAMFLAAIPILVVVCFRKNTVKKQILTLFSSGLIAVLGITPWFIEIFGGRLFGHMLNQVSTPSTAISDFTQQYNSIGPLTSYLPAYLWLILGAAVIYALWNKLRGALLVLGWWFIILLMANPALFNFPGEGAISNFAVFIAIYIPASVLIGSVIGKMADIPLQKWPLTASVFLAIFSLSISTISAKDRLLDVQPDRHALATYADIRAFKWINENLTTESKFLVNSFLAYGNTTAVGSDAGWWIPAMTGRQTSLPPILYGTEKPPYDGYAQNIKYLRTLAEEKGFTSSDFLAELKARGIKYAFIGQKNGSVNYFGTVKLNPDDLSNSGFYEPIYHEDNVWIFKIIQYGD